MLQRSRLLAVFALSSVFAFVLGCTEPAGLASDRGRENPSGPSPRTEHNPEGFGAVVIHAEQGAFLSGGDGLVMLIRDAQSPRSGSPDTDLRRQDSWDRDSQSVVDDRTGPASRSVQQPLYRDLGEAEWAVAGRGRSLHDSCST
jgi:hypothetical protein